MSSEPLSAQLIAEYDQALAESSNYLGALVQVYRDQRGKHVAMGVAEPVTVVGCSIWLAQNVPPEALASALAVAILGLSRDG